MKLPAISLWQPWASLLFADPEAKVHDTRHFYAPFKHLGYRIAIHAAGRPPPASLHPDVVALCVDRFGPDWRRTLPRGAFVGTAMLDASTRIGPASNEAKPASDADRACGDWTPGRFAWRLGDRRPLAEPVSANGFQGWFTAELPGDEP